MEKLRYDIFVTKVRIFFKPMVDYSVWISIVLFSDMLPARSGKVEI